jgi:hypothetical protein
MSASTIHFHNNRFSIGWITMLVASGLMALSYPYLILVEKEATVLFMSYTAFSIYGFLVLLIPFPEGEKWAWAATWILPVALALTGYFASEWGPYYYGAAAVFALGLLLTMKDFFSRQ